MAFLDETGLSYFWQKIQNAIRAVEDYEDARPSNLVVNDNGGCTVELSDSSMSIVEYFRTLTKKGFYTLYVSKVCLDNPSGAVAINSSLRGIGHLTLSTYENGTMCAWFVLFDQSGNMYTRYVGSTDSGWTSYAVTPITPDDMNGVYNYGTEDLVAGSSELEDGKLYFVYEE